MECKDISPAGHYATADDLTFFIINIFNSSQPILTGLTIATHVAITFVLHSSCSSSRGDKSGFLQKWVRSDRETGAILSELFTVKFLKSRIFEKSQQVSSGNCCAEVPGEKILLKGKIIQN